MKEKKLKRRNLLNYSTFDVVPYKYSPYLFDLNYIYSTSNYNLIVGRNKEITKIFNYFLKESKRNAILLGEHGVGKTAILQKIVAMTTKGVCPQELKDLHYVYFDVQAVIANINAKNVTKKINDIFNFILKHSNLVVVIDQIHLMQVSDLLSYYFSLLVKQKHICILGLTTENEFYEFFELDTKTQARLNIINVEEPEPKKIYPMIRKVVKKLEERHNVRITKPMIEYIINVSGAYRSQLAEPELTLDIIEKSMINAKRANISQVTRKEINKNFNFNYELYRKMAINDKKIIAYHEAGHFVVSHTSENIKDFKTTAITIVPGEDFLGITTFQFEPEKQLLCDINYFIDNIAVDLAGRVAEKILGNNYSSGADSDLRKATNTARAIITQFGMLESYGENMALVDDNNFLSLSLLSDENKAKINEETTKLIAKAYERAKQLLSDNMTLLERVANELLNNEILDEVDLRRICKEVEKAKLEK